MRELDSAVIDLWPGIYADAEPIDGPVRVTLTSLGMFDEPDPCEAAWPLAWSATDIAVPIDEFMDVPGNSVLISAPADYAALHQLRDEARGVDGCSLEVGQRLLDADGQRYSLFMRDALPVEADNGLIPLTAG